MNEELQDLTQVSWHFGQFSFFNPPIKPYTGKDGVKYSARLVPQCTMDVKTLWSLITADKMLESLTESLRSLQTDAERREFKSTKLAYVTPCGVFSKRGAKNVTSLSGLVVLDIDHLGSLEEAEWMRDWLFDDPSLVPLLAFVSPSGLGVKLFVPYVFKLGCSVGCYSLEQFETDGWQPSTENLKTVSEQILFGMDYLNMKLIRASESGLTRKQLECDFSGKDVSRACFLGYDAHARYREISEID